jgi:hypothetical protein
MKRKEKWERRKKKFIGVFRTGGRIGPVLICNRSQFSLSKGACLVPLCNQKEQEEKQGYRASQLYFCK